jgi:hypothetical protein
VLGEVSHQLPGDPAIPGNSFARYSEISQEALARLSDDVRLLRRRARVRLVPIAVSPDPLVAVTAAGLGLEGKIGAADPLEVALSLAHATEHVEGLGGGRRLDRRLGTGGAPHEREQRDTKTGERSQRSAW